MTVTTESNISGPFAGPGPVFTWTIWDIFDNGELEVLSETPEGVSSIRVLTTDYTVDISLKQITAVDAWAAELTSSHQVTIKRSLPLTQLEDPTNQGPLDPVQHEEVWDRGAMIDLQQQEELDRTYQVAIGEEFDPNALVADRYVNRPKLLASQIIKFSGVPVVNLEAFVTDASDFDRFLCEIAYVHVDGASGAGTLSMQFRAGGAWITGAVYSMAYNELTSTGVDSVQSLQAQTQINLSKVVNFQREPGGSSWASGSVIVNTKEEANVCEVNVNTASPSGAPLLASLRGAALMSSFADQIEGFRVFFTGISAEMVGTIRFWGLPRN